MSLSKENKEREKTISLQPKITWFTDIGIHIPWEKSTSSNAKMEDVLKFSQNGTISMTTWEFTQVKNLTNAPNLDVEKASLRK